MSNTQDMQKEINELKQELNECKDIIEAMSVPIIPSIIPETALLPITGKILPDRLEKVISEVSSRAYSTNITTIVIDFSAIGKNEIGELDVFGGYIVKINNTLKLLGVEVLYVGFTPDLIQEIVRSEFHADRDLKTFQTFRTALQYLMKNKGIKMINENEQAIY